MQRTKSGEFNWVDLSTKDFEDQSAFYVGLFGWTFDDMPYGNGQTTTSQPTTSTRSSPRQSD